MPPSVAWLECGLATLARPLLACASRTRPRMLPGVGTTSCVGTTDCVMENSKRTRIRVAWIRACGEETSVSSGIGKHGRASTPPTKFERWLADRLGLVPHIPVNRMSLLGSGLLWFFSPIPKHARSEKACTTRLRSVCEGCFVTIRCAENWLYLSARTDHAQSP
jgi:hypothetical protein